MVKDSVVKIQKVMIKKAIYMLVVFLFAIRVNAQDKGIISPDSLVILFKVKSPFEVLLRSQFRYLTNFKAAYYNQQLKEYTLKWLSKEEYRKFVIGESIKRFSDNPQNIKNAITRKLLKHNHGTWLDSIINSPNLYSKYRDSVIIDELAFRNSENKIESYLPPPQAIRWHSLLHYPEAYSIIRKLWEEAGKSVFEGGSFNDYFLALVNMGDPDARKLFDAEIKKFIKTQGLSLHFGELNSILKNMISSYGAEKMLELLVVKTKFEWLADSGDPPTPFNCEMRYNLMNEFIFNSIPMNPKLKVNTECAPQLKFKKEIQEAGQRLINKYKEQEKYWMENMPFNKQ